MPDVYTTRGVVRQAGEPPWQIEHERIPDFRDANGEAVGMDAMVMPFPIAEGVDTAGVAVGDKVELDFEVYWKGPNRGWAITRLRELPADTLLVLVGDAPSDPADGGHHHDTDHDHADPHGH